MCHNNIVGAPCEMVGEIRLVGGVDQFQGRVEVCTDDLVYSTVCSSGWDNLDAQVVCGQLGIRSKSLLVATTDERRAAYMYMHTVYQFFDRW